MTSDTINTEYVAQTMTYGGAGTAVVAGLSLSEVGVIIGIVVGIVGLCLQWYYAHRRDLREAEQHAKRMAEK